MLSLHQFESDLTDSYASYNATAVNTPTYPTGKVGNAIFTDPLAAGREDGAYIPDNDVFTIGPSGVDEPFSVSCWVNDNGSGDVRGWLVNKRGDNATTKTEWQLVYFDDGFYFELYDGSTTNRIGRSTTTTLTGSTWFHVVATYDGSESASGINIYVDGVDDDDADSNAGTYSGSANTTADVYIGLFGLGTSSTNGWDGYIDEVHIWNRELSATEVSDIYDIENAGNHITD